ncbi:hypothetical protein ABK040_002946 [Willaertia magna]
MRNSFSLNAISSVNSLSKIVEGGSDFKRKVKPTLFSHSEQSENIKVAIRVRPSMDYENEYEEAISVVDETTIVIKKGKARSEMFFDRVFPKESSQAEIYETVKETIEAVTKGYNGTVFAYGQTGTGKTFTMLGLDFSVDSFSEYTPMKYVVLNEKKGIIPRSVEHILSHIKKTKKINRYRIYCSYLEIYNEKIYDLLNYNEKANHLDVREDKKKGFFVPDLTTVCVTREEEIYALMEKGARNRSMASTDMNERSSRSHTIFQMFIEQEPINPSNSEEAVVKISKLNLVDLAGSEKWNTIYSQRMGERRIQEMTSINQSLSTLGNCISALNQCGRTHIPFRDSKLTRLLQDSLGGNTKTVFVATVSPSVLAYEETHSTLKFADRAKRVVVTTKVNEVVDDSILLKRYEKEIGRLRQIVDQNSKAQTRLDSLIEENTKLREENCKLTDIIKNNKDGNSYHGDVYSENIHLKIHKKLEILEEIERDQRGREKELEQYHDWLHSIPVKYDGEEHSLQLKERLILMEMSVKMQARELERTKNLFLRDIKIVKDELHEKTVGLQVVEKKLKEKQQMISELQNKLNDKNVKIAKEVVKKKELKDCSGIMSEIKSRQSLNLNHLTSGIESFRNNLISMIKEHLNETIGSTLEDTSFIGEEISELILGCSEALDETISTVQESFGNDLGGTLRKLIQSYQDIISEKDLIISQLTEEKEKLEKSFALKRKISEENSDINEKLVEHVKFSIKETVLTENDSYWEKAVEKADELKEMERQFYIKLKTTKGVFERVKRHVDKFENANSTSEFEFFKTQLGDMLTYAANQVDILTNKSYLSPNINITPNVFEAKTLEHTNVKPKVKETPTNIKKKMFLERIKKLESKFSPIPNSNDTVVQYNDISFYESPIKSKEDENTFSDCFSPTLERVQQNLNETSEDLESSFLSSSSFVVLN